ncbi:YeeE/YedE family protein [Methylobacillus gramineus]|uniref:YeeE/YedE family protein n=1 Tax=Methylobacillus gramineus TaxID=755169 RepID=UPI001CFF5A42|nr:YeeE/YedE family protein [Methylobacillus gramineus]MCB5185093.1 YeeE/YedE family protein [Methylobacillus gramineus]
MYFLSTFLIGLLFGVGLILSGMTNPAKVIGFLDLSGHWDPSLALVMGGAILVAFPAFQLAKKRSKSLLGNEIQLPKKTTIDRKLTIGAVIFGIGWGLGGYCPGPAVTSLISGGMSPFIFTITMLIGLLIGRKYQ